MELGEAVKRMMGKNLLTMTTLAREAGVSRQALYQSLERDIRLSTLLKLCEVMGCHLYIGDEDSIYEIE